MARLRIKDHDHRPDQSIAVVVAAALVIWVTWLLWTANAPMHGRQRVLAEVPMTYLCDAGHRCSAPGAVKSRACCSPDCDQRAWPVWTFQCSRHGGVALQLRYAIGDHDAVVLQSARRLGGAWREPVGALRELRCGDCERTLVPDYALREALLGGGSGQPH